jgi:hypothetical protein
VHQRHRLENRRHFPALLHRWPPEQAAGENHPLAGLFETPNPMMSGMQPIEAAFV